MPPVATFNPNVRADIDALNHSALIWSIHRAINASSEVEPAGRVVLVSATGGDAMFRLRQHGLFDRALPSATDIARPLLRKLEFPDAFVAAHLVLMNRWDTENRLLALDQPHEACEVLYDGLRITLHPTRPYSDNHRSDTVMFLADATIHPDQLRKLRDQWHLRLDRVALTVSCRSIVIGCMILAAGFVSAAWIVNHPRRAVGS